MKYRILLSLLVITLVLRPSKVSAQNSVTDSLALVDLYNSTNGNTG